MIEGGDGALEDVERLIRCSKITVQLRVRTLLSTSLTCPFGVSFNCPSNHARNIYTLDIRH